MPITGNTETTFNPNAPDVGSETPGAIVPTKAILLANGNTLLGWDVVTPLGGVSAWMQIFDAQGNPVGPAFAAPTEMGDARLFLDAVATSDGGFFAQISLSGEGVQFVRYDSAGNVVGQSLQYASQGATFEMQALPDGRLAVFAVDLFETPNGDGTFAYDHKAVLRIFDGTGQIVSETIVNANVQNTGGPINADIEVLPNGNIVVTWVEPVLVEYDTPTLHAQVFDSSGVGITAAFEVDQASSFYGFTTSNVEPVMAAFSDGSFVMLWNDISGTTFQLFNADGSPQGLKTALGANIGVAADFAISVTALPDMTFVVARAEGQWVNGDQSGTAIVARQFGRDGAAIGDPVTLNVSGAGDQSHLQLEARPGGGFSALWLDHRDLTELSGSYDPDLNLDVWRRRDFTTGTVINSAPAAQDGSASGAEDGTLSGQAVATDANNDALTYSLVNGPTHGTLTFNANGSYSYTPDANYAGADSFTFRTNDGSANSNIATITLSVAAVNDAPIVAAALANQAFAEDSAVSFALPAGSFTDVDDATLTLSATLADGSALPAWLAFNPATGSFTGTPPADFNSSLSIRVTATDSGGLTAASTFALDITAVNDTPTDIALSGANVVENAAAGIVVGTATATDRDNGDTLRFSLANDAGGRFAIDAVTGAVTVATGAVLDFEAAASHGIVIRVTDAAGASYDESFTITVSNANEAPDSLSRTTGGSVAENSASGTVVAQFAATDPDAGATLSYGLVDNAGGRFAINTTTGQLTVANGALLDFEAASSHNVTVRVTDQGGLSRDLTTTIAVTDVIENGPLNPIEGTDRSDFLFGSNGDDEINAGRGSDIIFARDGNDVVDAGLGDDFVDGGSGNDFIFGGQGRDFVLGGDGNDEIDGGIGADLLFGNAGDDRLIGGWGDDSIDGGAGNDTIIGGTGEDILSGGSGADRFVFEVASDSGVGKGNRDRILDFTRGSDLIDLSAIDANSAAAGNQSFSFIGNSAFHNVAGELRYANGILSGDINGDGVADFQIQISAGNGLPPPIAASDIIL